MRRTDKMRHYLQWPERHGFSIGGGGPSYVLTVTKGSAADKQGLKRGDQIIELNNHRVSQMAAPALEGFAKHIHNTVPTIKVVNNVQHVELFATRIHRYGLTLQYSQRHGFVIDFIQPRGPAYKAGLRQGDLVLEINGELIYEKSNSLAIMQKVLSAHRGKMTLAVLSCGAKSRSSQHSPSSASQHRTHPHKHTNSSKELYARMNNLFADNYEKKMALIAVLKSYADNRIVERLARSLVLILQTPSQRRIIPYIRLHIPVGDRRLFDQIIQRSVGKTYSEDRISQPAPHSLQEVHTPNHFESHRPHAMTSTPSSHSSVSYLRCVSVHKGDGDLGIVLRGRHPVVIETVLENSAAQKAGVLKGDCVLKINQESIVNSSHYEIQQLLRHSGPTVQLEVLQQVHMAKQLHNQHPINGVSHSQHAARIEHSYDSSTTSSRRSQSSSVDWAFQNSLRPQDRGPASFKTQVNYLLDKREKKLFKQYLFDYNSNKNIEVFVQRVSALLDTPAKRTLWSFVLPLLPSNHREYALGYVELPDSVINDRHEAAPSSSSRQQLADSVDSSSVATPDFGIQQPDTMTSFKSQLEFLLTSQERKAVKRALQRYRDSTDIQGLVETLSSILDTKSKRSLWIHILALLPASHQNYARRKVNLPSGFIRDGVDGPSTSSQYPNHHHPHTRRNRIYSNSEDEFFVVGEQSGVGGEEVDGADADRVEMLNYARKGSYEQRGAERKKTDRHLPGKHDPLSLSREADYPGSGVIADPGIYAYNAITLPEEKTGSYRLGKSNAAHLRRHAEPTSNAQPSSYSSAHSDRGHVTASGNGYSHSRDMTNPATTNGYFIEGHLPSDGTANGYSDRVHLTSSAVVGDYHDERQSSGGVITNGDVDDGKVADFPQHSNRLRQSGPRYLENGGHASATYYVNGNGEDIDGTMNSTNSSQLHNSQGSDASYTRRVNQALLTMDEAVAGFSGDETHRSELDQSGEGMAVKAPSPPLPPPPPPPPPPLPVPEAPPLPPDLSAPLLVKRLNWETHNPEEIDKTVWGQWNSTDQLDIQDMMESLGLPEQFATTKKKAPVVGKDKKVLKKKILESKKAFNTSIILRPLNKGTVEQRDCYIEQALLRVEVHSDDEHGVLTPSFLKQLEQYAPSGEEMANYKAYSGELSELCEVDRFCYRMVRIPGYVDRLKSMHYKATFDENCTQLEKNLELIKGASEQIRQSKSFAKILELVLAMGNQLNKATNRPAASAFKVSSLNQLDSTKTMDKQKSFLDVLVRAVDEKFPHLLSTSSELSQVPEANKVTYHDISGEITELQRVLQKISDTMGHLSAEAKHYTADDRFQEVMEHFVGSAEDRLQHLTRLQVDTKQQFECMLIYLGEKPHSADSKTIFSTISTFLTKFDNSHKLYAQKKLADLMSPRSPTSDTAQFISSL